MGPVQYGSPLYRISPTRQQTRHLGVEFAEDVEPEIELWLTRLPSLKAFISVQDDARRLLLSFSNAQEALRVKAHFDSVGGLLAAGSPPVPGPAADSGPTAVPGLAPVPDPVAASWWSAPASRPTRVDFAVRRLTSEALDSPCQRVDSSALLLGQLESGAVELGPPPAEADPLAVQGTADSGSSASERLLYQGLLWVTEVPWTEAAETVTRWDRLNWKKALNNRKFCVGRRGESKKKRYCLDRSLSELIPLAWIEASSKNAWGGRASAPSTSPNFESSLQPTTDYATILKLGAGETQEITLDSEEAFSVISLLPVARAGRSILRLWDTETGASVELVLALGQLLSIVDPARFLCTLRSEGPPGVSPEEITSGVYLLSMAPARAHVAPPPEALPPSLDGSVEKAADLERQFVHDVYDQIAQHFSNTRYKPWPRVKRFLQSLAPQSVILDVGCGNGKYACCRADAVWIGVDRSAALLECAMAKGHKREADRGTTVHLEGLVGDCVKLNLRSSKPGLVGHTVGTAGQVGTAGRACRARHFAGIVDACLSIAVIHHLATESKRLAALDEMLRCVRPGGHLLVCAWAFEQVKGSIGARRFDSQDVFIPWHLQNRRGLATTSSTALLYRYYHVFSESEFRELCRRTRSGRLVGDIFYDCNNWMALIERL